MALFNVFSNSILLEPISTFLYTWRFLDSLDYEHQGTKKALFKRTRIVLVFLVPLVYFGLYLTVVELTTKQDLLFEKGEFEAGLVFSSKYRKLMKAVGYWTSFVNFFSCAVLGLVIQYVCKLTKQPIEQLSHFEAANSVNEKLKLNFLVTSSHIVLVTAYTILIFFSDNFDNLRQSKLNRINTSSVFFTGLIDLFMSYMMWFMTDSRQEVPTIVRDEKRSISYTVLNVIKDME